MNETKKVLTYDILRAAVEEGAAFRCRRKLYPAGGPGDKVFPPTFSGARYAEEKRQIPEFDEPVNCVLLDSVQSQANRMELALQDAIDDGRIQIPLIQVDFTPFDPSDEIIDIEETGEKLISRIGKLTSLQVPHRIADAIIRDSELDGIEFRKSEIGKSLNDASQNNATPIFRLCPTALVFGVWDSTGPKGGLGPKFERAIVSEIVGINAEIGDLRRGVRRDPLEIRSKVKVLKEADGSWKIAQEKAKNAKSPSAINHSSVPFPESIEKKNENNYYDGITIAYAQQITTISLICLRRLRFPINGVMDEKINKSARTILAALGLCGATLAFEKGAGLRSRCLLWPDETMTWELLSTPGSEAGAYTLTGEQAIDLLASSIARKPNSLLWNTDTVRLLPKKDLIDLVRMSQVEEIRSSEE
jgi:CRISPR-associated protein Csb1